MYSAEDDCLLGRIQYRSTWAYVVVNVRDNFASSCAIIVKPVQEQSSLHNVLAMKFAELVVPARHLIGRDTNTQFGEPLQEAARYIPIACFDLPPTRFNKN